MPRDRLSDLPDDLLRRVLHFAPAREGASTAALSRRWRALWRSSATFNLDLDLDSLFPGDGDGDGDDSGGDLNAAERFLRGAEAALAAASSDGPLRRLAFRVEADDDFKLYAFLRFGADHSMADMVADLLRTPAARRLEEIHILAADRHGQTCYDFFELDFCALPSETLRVLHLGDHGALTPPPPGAAAPSFRRLADLRLTGCAVSLAGLQRIVDAAPQLAAVHLEYSDFRGEFLDDAEAECDRLVFPAVISLVFAQCKWLSHDHGLELDAPKLRYFRYKGIVHLDHGLSLRPQPSSKSDHLIRVDVHLIDSRCEEDKICAPLWQFLQNFGMARVLKLKLDFAIDHMAVTDDKGQEDLLGNRLFYNVENLEIEGPYDSKSNAAAVAIGNLLNSCPVVCDLRLRLTEASVKKKFRRSSSLAHLAGIKEKLDFEKSVNQFRLRRTPAMLSGGDYDEDYEVTNIPGLSEHSFSCLQSYLRRVVLEFHMDKPNCFGVQLAKFFAENAEVLQELYIDDGNHKLWEHVNRKVQRWVINSSKKINFPATTDLQVLPYESLK
ncbi:hypothetical protein ACP4OV_002053 [Aristida adscensionis]